MCHPAFGQAVFVIVVEFLDGLRGEVAEVLVKLLGVEPDNPFGGVELALVDVAPGPWRRICSFLNDPKMVVSAMALSRASSIDTYRGIDAFISVRSPTVSASDPEGLRHRSPHLSLIC